MALVLVAPVVGKAVDNVAVACTWVRVDMIGALVVVPVVFAVMEYRVGDR